MNILILGGGYAGTLTAIRLAGRTRRANITLVNAAPELVQRIRLHELATGKAPRLHAYSKLLRGKNITFVQGKVTAVAPDRRAVTVEHNGATQTLHYDKLVYALGSYPDLDATPGVREHAFTLDGSEAAKRLQTKLAENPRARVVVCGGGLTGIELASEIAESYPQLNLTLLSRDPLGPNLSQRGYTYVQNYFQRHNVNVREGVTVARVLENGVITTSGEHIEADFTLWAGSFTVSPLAGDAGFAVNPLGQILVDPFLRSTSHRDVFAVGDAAASGLRMSCAAALPQGAHAADNLAALLKDQPMKPFRFGFSGRCISLGRRDALVQVVEADDTPREQIITGRGAAVIKELICRYAVSTLYWTRHLPGAFMWSQPRDVIPAAEPARQHA